MAFFFAKAFCNEEKKAQAIGLTLERFSSQPVGLSVFESDELNEVWEINAYFDGYPNELELAIVETVYKVEFVISALVYKDWVSSVLKHLKPVIVDRFIIYGEHDKYKLPENKICIRVEAALAFGTGHHASTVGCLRALSRLAKRGVRVSNIADIGCGTGILAMCASKVFKCDTLAADIDPLALQTVKANIIINGIQTFVVAVKSDGFNNREIIARSPFDLIFANILAQPLIRLVKGISRHTKLNGRVILSGMIDKQASRVENVYRTHGFVRNFLFSESGWTTLVLQKKAKKKF